LSSRLTLNRAKPAAVSKRSSMLGDGRGWMGGLEARGPGAAVSRERGGSALSLSQARRDAPRLSRRSRERRRTREARCTRRPVGCRRVGAGARSAGARDDDGGGGVMGRHSADARARERAFAGKRVPRWVLRLGSAQRSLRERGRMCLMLCVCVTTGERAMSALRGEGEREREKRREPLPFLPSCQTPPKPNPLNPQL
jgi:hypothetical protein